MTDAGKEYHSLGNVQINEILGAETFPVGTAEDTVLQQLKSQGKKPYAIPSGASSHPLGGLGYARWIFEVLEQEAQLGVQFDTIVVTIGSGSTMGGMIAGLKLAQKQGLINRPRRLVGFSIMGKSDDVVREMVRDIAQTTAEKVRRWKLSAICWKKTPTLWHMTLKLWGRRAVCWVIKSVMPTICTAVLRALMCWRF